MGRRATLMHPELADLLDLSVRCRTQGQYQIEMGAWLDRAVGFDSLYLGPAFPEVPKDPFTLRVDEEARTRCEAQADLHWNDRIQLNRGAAQRGGVAVDVDVLGPRVRDRMFFYREVVAGLGIRLFAVGILEAPGRPTQCIYLGRTSRGARFKGGELAMLRAAVPILAMGHALHDRVAVSPGASDLDSRRGRLRDTPGPPAARLTAREDQILLYLSKGLRNAEIASALGTSPATVKNQVSAILTKLDVSNRTELAGRMAEGGGR